MIGRPVDALPPRGSLGLLEEIGLRGGGCALNTASALARLGLRAGVAGKVGADPFGDFLLGLLDERGVDRAGVVRDPVAATSASIVLVGGDGERTFLHAMGADGSLRAEELDPERLYAGRCLHVGGALVLEELDGDPLAAILAEARRRGLVTSLDTTWDPSGRWHRVEPLLRHVDLACPSLAEAQAIAGEDDPARVAAWFRARGVGTVALTAGPDGCYADAPGFAGWVPAPRVVAVDGTGAGDAFAAGLLHATLAGRPVEEALGFACAAGALATRTVGAYEGVGDLEETAALAASRRAS